MKGKGTNGMTRLTASTVAGPAGHVRWLICALLFAATTINYIDRAVLGVLKPALEQELGWTQVDYGWIVTAFQITYALGYIGAGRLFDHIGVRIGFLASVSLWSVAAMAHAVARSVPGFCLARAGLGLAEGGNFPAAVKTVAEWFPKQERALATGLFNAGSNIGAVACPLLVPWLAGRWCPTWNVWSKRPSESRRIVCRCNGPAISTSS
jgi:ACS family hexuronate transporter-like MFS transporter